MRGNGEGENLQTPVTVIVIVKFVKFVDHYQFTQFSEVLISDFSSAQCVEIDNFVTCFLRHRPY